MRDGSQRGRPTAEGMDCRRVEEAYIHCSKHVPLLARRDKQIVWGTDDERLRAGTSSRSRPTLLPLIEGRLVDGDRHFSAGRGLAKAKALVG